MDENTAKLINDLVNSNPTGTQIIIGGQDISYNKFVIDGKKEEYLSVEDMFNKAAGGISDRSQFWLLLVAAQARGKDFDNIPSFVEEAYSIWQIPFDKNECIASTQEKMKSLAWSGIRNQQTMIEFINENVKQRNIREQNLKIANRLYVALKENPWGQK